MMPNKRAPKAATACCPAAAPPHPRIPIAVCGERVPRKVFELLGTGRPDCRRCCGDGVVVVVSFTGPVFRPCACLAGKGTRCRPAGPDLWVSQPKHGARSPRPTLRRRAAG